MPSQKKRADGGDRFDEVTDPQGPRGLRRGRRSESERSSIVQELEERTLPDGLRTFQISEPEESDPETRIEPKMDIRGEPPDDALILGHMMADEIGLVVEKGTPLFDFLKEELEKEGAISLEGIEGRYREFLGRLPK